MKIINRIVFTLNIIAILALLASYLAPYVSPIHVWPLAFFGLAFPFLISIHFVFLMYWIFQLDLRLLFSGIALLIGYPQIKNHLQFGAIKSAASTDSTLQILSFNAHGFGLYDTKKYDLEPFYETLNELHPDILCFQEFDLCGLPEQSLVNLKTLQKHGLNYRYSINDETLPFTGYSLFILSKYKIIQSGFAERVNRFQNLSIYADIVVKHDTFRIINTHLKSIAFDPDDFKTYDNMDEPSSLSIRHFKHLFRKLKYGFQRRAKQVNALREFMDQSPYPIILCGDFNDTPNSFAYQVLKGDLQDAFVKAGSGLSRTYVGKMPSFRIDYILADPRFQISNYKPYTLSFSDHRLITSSLHFQ